MPDPRTSTVSFIVPAYNAARYLSQALDAALAQDHPAHEVLVVDDGSRDETPQICARYGDRITYIRQENRGEAGARNRALEVATGKYIALLDADDVCTADRLSKQVGALERRPDAVACFSGHSVFTDAAQQAEYAGIPANGGKTPVDFLCRLLVHPITMMFRREQAGGLQFPLGVRTGGDMIFTGLLRRRGPFTIISDVLYGYRRHPAQVTASHTDMDSLNQRLDWLKRHPEAGPEIRFEDVEANMWQAFAEALGQHYWLRREREFLLLRDQLRTNWPAHLPRPRELVLRWYPSWLWALKGRVDQIRGRSRLQTMTMPATTS
jgi:glycosyltransferase involved in cell wall biosynthesis